MTEQPHPTLSQPWGDPDYDPSCEDCREGRHGRLADKPRPYIDMLDPADPPSPGLRAALRSVLRDFDREPTEEYLDEAERIFIASSPAPAGLDVEEPDELDALTLMQAYVAVREADDGLGSELDFWRKVATVAREAALASSPAPAGLDDLRARIETNLRHAERRPDDDFYRGKAAAFRVVLTMLDGPPNPTFVCGRPER